MQERVLDYIFVPAGLLVMVAYHLWLLYRIIMQPNNTIIGINSINRRFWVYAMMEDAPKNGVLAVQTLRNNIMASTLLASTAIMLSSLIAVLMTGGSKDRKAFFVFGNRSELAFSIKFFAILVCFLVAFLFNVQSIRYYSHASILINTPFKRCHRITSIIISQPSMLPTLSTEAAISGPWASVPSISLSLCFCGSLGPFPCSCPALFWSSCSISWMSPFSLDGLLGLPMRRSTTALTRMRNKARHYNIISILISILQHH
ncbi:unnamed protein product [Prunus armeniaca]|uniref:Uncharacterized protein n=1 Tax=Prunus armeniaca TaxID=36596 RepID=A0A6J5WUS6_PRUAR|nr:unnamed protein product [Prunus armeniaca]